MMRVASNCGCPTHLTVCSVIYKGEDPQGKDPQGKCMGDCPWFAVCVFWSKEIVITVANNCGCPVQRTTVCSGAHRVECLNVHTSSSTKQFLHCLFGTDRVEFLKVYTWSSTKQTPVGVTCKKKSQMFLCCLFSEPWCACLIPTPAWCF